MNKITRNTTTTLAAIVMLGGALAQSTDAQASATYRRSKITTVKKANYYSIKNGKTYKMTGSAKKLQLKANHNLKSYKNSTWVKSKQTTITKHGKKYLYYYVTSQKNGAKGWVWNKDLKIGKNYQMTNAKGLKSKNYIKAKSGKIYQLQGSNKYMKLTNGKAISAKKTYKVTQQRHIYKNGKTYKYYYVTSGKTSGWTWNKYLKAGTYHAPVKKGTSSSQASQTTSSSSQAGSSSATKPTGDKEYNASVVASDVATLINQARSQVGSGALASDGVLTQIGNARGPQLVKNFAHEDENGVSYAKVLAQKAGIYDTYFGTEDCTSGGVWDTNMETAKQLVNNYRNSSPHWTDLMNNDFTKVGVGVYRSENTLFVSVELGF